MYKFLKLGLICLHELLNNAFFISIFIFFKAHG